MRAKPTLTGIHREISRLTIVGISVALAWSAAAQCPVEHDPFLSASVAVFGDTIVGTDNGANAVSVLERVGLSFRLSTHLMAPPNYDVNSFGSAVGLSRDRCVVGAPLSDFDVGEFECLNCGTVFVYERRAGRWYFIYAVHQFFEGMDQFGAALTLEADRMLVGLPGSANFAGRVCALDRNIDGAWVVVSTDRGSQNNHIGSWLALSGDRYIVGFPNAPTPYVHVFERRSDGVWALTATLNHGDSGSVGLFGSVLAISGTTIVCGANSNGDPVVYVYERQPDGAWPRVARLNIGAAGSGGVGLVALENDVLLAASGLSTQVLRRVGGTWTAIGRIPTVGSAALSGNYAVVAGEIYAIGPDTDNDGTPDLCQCIGDFDSDGAVTITDLCMLLANFGAPGGATRAMGDSDADSDVDLLDLALLLSRFGAICE